MSARAIALSAAACALAAITPVVAQEASARATTEFTLTTGSARTAEQRAVRFDKADLSFSFDFEAKTLAGHAVLDFTATAAVSRIVVELDTVFDISRITVDGRALPPARWSNPEGRLTIELPRTLRPGQSVAVGIAYSGAPRVAPRAPWDGGFVWARAPGGEPWVATAVQGEGCDLFWPCIDHPQGEPGRVDLHITVPSNLSAPSNGVLVGKTDNGDGTTTWNWTARDPTTYGIALNIGPYVERHAVYRSRFGNDIPVYFWALNSAPAEKADALFAELPLMLDFYEATVGPYPFADEKVGVVETPHLGMEHQTINAYGNQYRLDGRGFDWLLHHELAHEWFGNQITNVDWDDMWLHEGLGSYVQPLYDRWLHGDRAMEVALNDMRRGLINRFPVVAGRPQTGGEVYENATGPGNDIYSKGALIAHTLRLHIGEEAFWRAVRMLVYGRDDPAPGNFTPRYASTPDFIGHVNTAAGRDLGWFFDAYLYQAALPELRQTREGGRLTLEWITGDGGPFPMPVEIEVDGRLRVVDMTGNRAVVAVPAGAHVVIDPADKVLRRLDRIETWRASRGR